MSSSSAHRRRRLWQAVALASACALACGCGTGSAPHASPAAPRVIDLFGASPPPALPLLARAQAARLPTLAFTFGPAYHSGRILGLAISYPGCEQIKGATVTETATAVKVRVAGTPEPANCAASSKTTSAAINLPVPLGHRQEIHG